MGLYHGVYAMEPAFPGTVGASANLGRAGTEEDVYQVCAFLRSARPEWEAELAGRHKALGAAHGFTLSVTGYPGWPGDRPTPWRRCWAGCGGSRPAGRWSSPPST